MPFIGPVVLRLTDEGRWRLAQDVAYRGLRDEYLVQRGFSTDGASVPRIVRWLREPFNAKTLRAALVHDYLWGEHRAGRLVSRRDADGLFRRILREEGVPFLERWVMWAAVRIGDGFEGGMSAREWLAFTALLLGPGLLVVLASVLPAIVLGVFWLLRWVLPR